MRRLSRSRNHAGGRQPRRDRVTPVSHQDATVTAGGTNRPHAASKLVYPKLHGQRIRGCRPVPGGDLPLCPSRSTASADQGSTIMATTARIARVLMIATGILALSATAAQAGPNPYSARDIAALYQHDAAAKISSVRSPAVDPANAQLVYHRVYGPQALYMHDAATQAVNVADSGFNWTDGLLGAGIATLVLLLAAITASRIRPQ